MERASGIRRLMQNMLFPDLEHLVTAAESLDRRVSLLDKGLGALEKNVGKLDERVDQLDKGMVQMDHGLNRLDKEMIRLSKGIDRLNKGMDQLNKDVDQREKDLTVRLSSLKAKLENDHARAMGEVAALLQVHAFDERNPEPAAAHSPETTPELAGEAKYELIEEESQPDRARAISELSAALGPQAAIEAMDESRAEPVSEQARALSELAALLGSSRRLEQARVEAPRPLDMRQHELKDDLDFHIKSSNGHPPPLDFAAVLEHIRNREATV